METTSFADAYKAGRKWEALVVANWPDKLELLDGREAGDILVKPTGCRLELKTESRSMATTKNVYLERYGNTDTQAPGGPWQALAKGVEAFGVLYASNYKLFVFPTKAVVARAEEYIKQHNPKLYRIKSDGYHETYYTAGYALPRIVFDDLPRAEFLLDPEVRLSASKTHEHVLVGQACPS